ncbi:hypothetical protein G4Y79_05875 [Phototrophicus methaneseepsis]|uniref:Squalene cyclase C-terminal domain-containing protein n=1 Tax=Phototrophicus methaneseepsis TaxID=2710758 RepID=A0A7S8EBI9_9CHLR|nr:hypothetical protein [Phototrophicus methaneseepsis]QPC83906.1 hypothetical protein G4Y79_05875 [Phototrophicus methaneseepsis]
MKRGEQALWHLVGKLNHDDSDTVGFPILSASLTEEALAMGLDVPQPPIRYAAPFQKKVKTLLNANVRDWQSTTIVFSLEALRMALRPDEGVLSENGSVCISPSATAGHLLNKRDDRALKYLSESLQANKSGAVPAVYPIDIFEIAWSLVHLKNVGAIEPDHPNVRKALDFIWSKWSPKEGIATGSSFPIADMDDTAACFIVLDWGGYPVSLDVFEHYEKDTHFCCYHHETNPAMSAHVRLLLALRSAPEHPKKAAWIEKTVNALRTMDDNGTFWWDKWHASPYYVNSTAITALHGLDNELARNRVKWIVRTQQDDGGWGYYGTSTAEETAYCLLTLIHHHQFYDDITMHIINEGAKFLMLHAQDSQKQGLWIGKSLYTPTRPVEAAVLSALVSYHRLQYGEQIGAH